MPLNECVLDFGCEIFINEINIIDPKKPEKKEHIELKSTCDTEIALRGYKLNIRDD